ncbi:hypothetical protein ABKU22_22560, partial [Enterobacter roggenkampii]
FVVGGPVGDSELLLCHGMVCVVGRMRDLILQLSKSSIYSTKPICVLLFQFRQKLIYLGLSLLTCVFCSEGCDVLITQKLILNNNQIL